MPLVNLIAESGSYEWLKSGPVCSLRVYWAHPPLESVRGLLIATRVQLLEASSLKPIEKRVLSLRDVYSSRKEAEFQVQQGLCSNKAEVYLRVHLHSMILH